jgi:hypothetical protein
MSKLFLTNIDLNGNQLLNSTFQKAATAPTVPTPVSGQMYYNTTDNFLYVYNGTTWDKVLESGSVVNADIASGANIDTAKLSARTISGKNLGSNLDTLTFDVALGSGTYNGSAPVTVTPRASSTSQTGIVQLTDSTSSTSITTAATPNSVKTAFDLANGALQRSTGGTMAGAINMGSTTGADGFNITGLKTPANALDAATKGYVDATRSGLDVKDSVRVATTANITLSSTQTIDTVAVIAGDRVLVKNQTNNTENGIWVVAAGAWARAADASQGTLSSGAFTFVESGSAAQADSGWVMTTDGTITIGTSPIAWSQFSGAGQIDAGAGLTKTGNTIDVVTADVSRIVVNPNSIDLATVTIADTTPNQGNTAITGVTKDSYGRVTGVATSTRKATPQNPLLTVNSGSAVWTITHTLNTQDVIVQLREVATNETVEAEVVMTNSTTVTVTIASTAANIPLNTYRAVIIA